MKITSDTPLQATAPLSAAATAQEIQKPRAGQAALFTREISQAQQALNAIPDVDMQRVAIMKEAIKNGTLLTDNASLATSMTRFYRS